VVNEDMSFDPEYYAKKLAEVEAGNRLPFLELLPGDNKIRVLPPPKGERNFWIERKISYKVGPKKKMLIPIGQTGKPDPFFEYLNALQMKSDPVSQAELKAIKPRDKWIVIVVNRRTKILNQWTIDYKLFKKLLSIMVDPQYGNFVHTQTGVDLNIKITKNAQTGYNDTDIIADRNSSPLGTADEIALWTGKNWFTEYNIGTYSDVEYTKAVLTGTVDEFLKARKAQRAAETQASGTAAGAAVAESAPAVNPALHDEAEALRKRLAALEKPKGEPSKVGDDLRSALS
jgi:hypothetical protein